MVIAKISVYLFAICLAVTNTNYQRNIDYLNRTRRHWYGTGSGSDRAPHRNAHSARRPVATAPGTVPAACTNVAWFDLASPVLTKLSTRGRAQTISIENTIGVITLSDEDPDHGNTWTATLFNEDGSIWYEFSFYDENRDHPFDPSRVDFRPFAFYLENFLLVFKCVGEDANRFEVIVNEKTGLKKFVKKNDRVFKYQTWEDHVLHQFAVDFDESNNPLRSMPLMRARLVRAPKDVFFHPVKIESNWLRVNWDVSEAEGVKSTRGKKKIVYGWIKWKEGNNLIIELLYFA